MPVFGQRPELLVAFQAGDPDALEELYWFYKDRVESIVRFGARPFPSRGEVEDLVQEIYTKAFAKSDWRPNPFVRLAGTGE
jgi:hypothetical protein